MSLKLFHWQMRGSTMQATFDAIIILDSSRACLQVVASPLGINATTL